MILGQVAVDFPDGGEYTCRSLENNFSPLAKGGPRSLYEKLLTARRGFRNFL